MPVKTSTSSNQSKISQGAQFVARKGIDAAGNAAGVNAKEIREGIQDARDMAGGPASAKAWKGAGKLGKKVAKNTASTALTAATGVPKGFYDKGIDLVTSKKFWRNLFIILALLGLVVFMLLDGSIFDAPPTDEPTTSDTCVPDQFTGDAFGKTAVCTISVTYDGSASDVTIISTILPGTEYVSSGVESIVNAGRGGSVTVQQKGGTYDKASNSVTWDAGRLGLPLDPININVTVTVRITTHQKNTAVYNAYSVSVENLQSGTTGSSTGPGGNVPPNHSTCNGKYNLNSPYENFGDPNCDFTIQQFGQEVRQMDSAHYLIWDCMTAHESGYNPNAYNPNSASGKGAFGLLQMNPRGQGNGKYDAGNVVWSLQISNAINYNKIINGSFAYWATYAGCH